VAERVKTGWNPTHAALEPDPTFMR